MMKLELGTIQPPTRSQNITQGNMLTWSRHQFNMEAQQFTAKLSALEYGKHETEFAFLTGWSLKQDGSTPHSFYLSHSPLNIDVEVCHAVEETLEIDAGDDEEAVADDTILQDDPSILVSTPNKTKSTTATWFFSIVYSDTWKSPILYFNVDLDGTPCSRSTTRRRWRAT